MAPQDFVLSGWWGSPDRNQKPGVGSMGQPASPKAGSPAHPRLQARAWGTSELALGQVLTPAVTYSLGHSGNAGIHPLPPTWSLWTPGSNPDWEEKAEANGGRETFHTQDFPPSLENSTLQADSAFTQRACCSRSLGPLSPSVPTVEGAQQHVTEEGQRGLEQGVNRSPGHGTFQATAGGGADPSIFPSTF